MTKRKKQVITRTALMIDELLKGAQSPLEALDLAITQQAYIDVVKWTTDLSDFDKVTAFKYLLEKGIEFGIKPDDFYESLKKRHNFSQGQLNLYDSIMRGEL